MAARDLDVSISLSGERATTGRATILERALLWRLWRAATTLLAIWAFAALMIMIPIAHWVLVPTFGLVGVVMAIVRLFEDVTLLGVQGSCPRCRVERKFETSGRYRTGRTIHCDGCGAQVEINEVPQLPA